MAHLALRLLRLMLQQLNKRFELLLDHFSKLAASWLGVCASLLDHLVDFGDPLLLELLHFAHGIHEGDFVVVCGHFVRGCLRFLV